MGHAGLDQSETEVLEKILSRVGTVAPPPGSDIDAVYAAWPNQAGRDYIDALYRPKPIGALLSDELILQRQWFLMTLSHVVTAEDAASIIRRAASGGRLAEFEIHDKPDLFGLSRRQPTRLARFVSENLAPQLDEAPLACTAELLVARAAIQMTRRDHGVWPPAFIQPEQRHSIEVELVLLAESAKTFTWHRDEGGRFVFRSVALAKSLQSSSAQSKKANEKLAAAELKIKQLSKDIERLESVIAAAGEAGLVDRFKQVYRKHVLAYHPDKLMGRPEPERRVGEEVTRVLNALYDDIKI